MNITIEPRRASWRMLVCRDSRIRALELVRGMIAQLKRQAARVVSCTKVLLNDRCMFPAFEAALIVLFLYAKWVSRERVPVGSMSATIGIKPSPEARALLYGAYSAFAAVVGIERFAD